MIPNQVYDISKMEPKEPIIFMLDKFDLTTNKSEIEKVKRLWNKYKEGRLKNLYKQGYPLKLIRQYLRCTYKELYQKIEELGLRR